MRSPACWQLCTDGSANQAAGVIGRVGQPDAGNQPPCGVSDWLDNWLLA